MDQRYITHKCRAIPRGIRRTLSWSYIALLLILPLADPLFDACGPGAALPPAPSAARSEPSRAAFPAPTLAGSLAPGVVAHAGLPSPCIPDVPAPLAADEPPTDAEEPPDDGFALLSMPLGRGPQLDSIAFAAAAARNPLCIFAPPVPPPRTGRLSATITL